MLSHKSQKEQSSAPANGTVTPAVANATGTSTEITPNAENTRRASATPAARVLDPNLPLAYGISIVTMLMTIDQIMEAHDRFPGRDERQQKVAKLIREFQELTVIPKNTGQSPCGKEVSRQ